MRDFKEGVSVFLKHSLAVILEAKVKSERLALKSGKKVEIVETNYYHRIKRKNSSVRF